MPQYLPHVRRVFDYIKANREALASKAKSAKSVKAQKGRPKK